MRDAAPISERISRVQSMGGPLGKNLLLSGQEGGPARQARRSRSDSLSDSLSKPVVS
jgi:hypothetical protein